MYQCLDEYLGDDGKQVEEVKLRGGVYIHDCLADGRQIGPALSYGVLSDMGIRRSPSLNCDFGARILYSTMIAPMHFNAA